MWIFMLKKKSKPKTKDKPFCLSYCMEKTLLSALMTHVMNIQMLFQTVWRVFNEKGDMLHLSIVSAAFLKIGSPGIL